LLGGIERRVGCFVETIFTFAVLGIDGDADTAPDLKLMPFVFDGKGAIPDDPATDLLDGGEVEG
jgi:hypothetical protein